MSNVILVLKEMPDSCLGCPCFNDTNKWCNLHSVEDLEKTYITHKPDWCPLKPLPQKIKYSMYDFPQMKDIELVGMIVSID